MKKSHLLFLLLPLALAPVVLNADSVVEEIIARVDNSIITRSEFLRSKDQLKDEIRQQDPGNFDKDYAEKEKDVLRDLIDRQLLLEKGKDLGITADTELVKRLDEMRKQMNLDSMEELEKAAQSQGVSFEDFKQNLREQIITQQVIGREVGSHITISKEEEQQFYQAHKADMQQPEQIRLSEILVSTQKPATPPPAPNPADPAAPAPPAATAPP
ncbi:MAG TPA: SurA N-terminal domain-containing protein, partial [Terriglobia bacterium]|nr:SurA N-terminal domain-containing protein [Terriglobia bacterium]